VKSQVQKFQAIKGVRDILPPDSALWNYVEQTAREVFGTYGFSEIRLPIFEPTELFARAVGIESDVVSKEMYSFEDRGWGALAMARQVITGFNLVPRAEVPRDQLVTELGKYHAALNSKGVQDELPRDADNSALIQAFNDGYPQLVEVMEFQDAEFKSEFIDAHAWGLQSLAQIIRLGQNVSLRPEATASAVRAYIQHGMQTRPGNVKIYYIGPMFRRERPQKGRYRQFYQIGAELLGSSDHAALDAELIEMLLTFFDRVGLKGAKLQINSIGDKNCRPAYVVLLRAELEKVRDRLGPDSQRRIETNPLRVLDSKAPEEQTIIAGLPHIADHLCAECSAHYAQLKQELALRGVEYEENWRLVRGLDYYMRTTFEITAPGLGSQDAVCGGGRYDGLVELLGGPPTKGIGFAIGTDRVILSLEQAGVGQKTGAIDVYLAWMGAAAYPAAVALARKLRQQGIAVEVPAGEMKFGKSLGLADRLGARYAVILGEDELASGQFTVKNLTDGEQKKLVEAELVAYITSNLGEGRSLR
jgi:histidyl-tRNA synthetase